MIKPYEIGLWAYEKGLNIDDNPYSEEKMEKEYDEWRKGWRRGQLRAEAKVQREKIKRE